jgi:hypothetical protein
MEQKRTFPNTVKRILLPKCVLREGHNQSKTGSKMARLSRFVIPQTEGIFDFFEEMKFFFTPDESFFQALFAP